MCDRFPRKFDVQTSYIIKPSNYVLGPIFVVNIKFPRATYHSDSARVDRRTLLFKYSFNPVLVKYMVKNPHEVLCATRHEEDEWMSQGPPYNESPLWLYDEHIRPVPEEFALSWFHCVWEIKKEYS